MNFRYGKKEMEYLKSRDRRLGEVIGQIGRIRWTVEPDLFSAIVQNIVSQQISGKAAESILARVGELLGEITPKSVAKTDIQAFRSCGSIASLYFWMVAGGAIPDLTDPSGGTQK